MRAPASLLAVAVVAAALAGCSGAATPTGPGIEARTAITPEERSTCEALARVDLAVVDTEAAGRERAAAALEETRARAPEAIRPALDTLAHAYRTSAEAAGTDPSHADVVYWFNQRCGGTR